MCVKLFVVFPYYPFIQLQDLQLYALFHPLYWQCVSSLFLCLSILLETPVLLIFSKYWLFVSFIFSALMFSISFLLMALGSICSSFFQFLIVGAQIIDLRSFLFSNISIQYYTFSSEHGFSFIPQMLCSIFIWL